MQVVCRECKQLVDSMTILEHYRDSHVYIAKTVFEQKQQLTSKLNVLEQKVIEEERNWGPHIYGGEFI